MSTQAQRNDEKMGKLLQKYQSQTRDEKGKFGPKLPEAKTFVEWLRNKRVEFGLEFYSSLADKLGMREDRISRIMAGKYAPSTNELENIFKNLNIKERSEEYCLLLHLAYKSQLQVKIKPDYIQGL